MRLSSQFHRLWFGQWLSNLGSQISFYGLGLWLFTRADQIGPYAAIALAVQLGRLLALPLLSRHLQRWPRRRAMGIAYFLGGGVTTLVALSFWTYGSALPFPLLMALLFIGAMAEATLVLSFSTLIPQLVRDDQIGRANGFFATSDGLVYLVAPFLGALCVARLGLAGVLFIDFFTFAVAFICLNLGSWPTSGLSPLRLDAGSISGLRAASCALLLQPKSGALLLLSSSLMAGFAAAELFFPAWILATRGADHLIVALAVSAASYFLGLLLWQRFWVYRSGHWFRVFALGLLTQAFVLTGALFQFVQDTVWLMFIGVALFNCSVPPVLAAQQSLWHRWIPMDIQPVYFAARYSWEWTARLFIVAFGGVFIDRCLSPFLMHNVSSLFGSGPGRALAVSIGVVGISQLIIYSLVLTRYFIMKSNRLNI